jgi:hypothetical protein
MLFFGGNLMAIRNSILCATAMIAAALLQTSSVSAHGAIAVGAPDDIATDGVAVGYAWNNDSSGEAEAAALKNCLAYMDAPDKTRARCKVVQSFQNKCLAVSLDPAAGTEGFGWSVAATKQDAADAALSQCRDTDGAAHADACAVQVQVCDGE